ncbi:MAG: GntR family transcriptional regulator [Ardenticatenaceae bacterium]|nr:GntR family transcriptional regulator [Ardenticatenaceae bacterium]
MSDDGHVAALTTIDRNSPLPLYYQLKQILLRQIQNNDIPAGEPLPSEKDLQERYDVSRITVRRALSDLTAEGYLSRQAGRGTFVLHPKVQDRSETLGGFIDDLIAQGFSVESRILSYGMRPASRYVADKLGIDEGQPLLYFQKLVDADGEPIALTEAFINVDEGVTFTPEELNVHTVYPLLERKCGLILRRANKTLEATLALEDEAALLHVKPGTPMLLAHLIVSDERGQPGAFVKALYRGDRYKAYLTVTR